MKVIGICNLSAIALRAEPSHRAEMISQLLYGETYEVTHHENKDWLKIRCEYDSYEGFIPSNQFFAFSFPTHPLLFIGDLGNDDTNNLIPKGAEIYDADRLVGVEREELIDFKAINFTIDQIKENVFFHSTSLLNAPYLWGGRTPWGLDCSGFTQLIFKLVGIKLPRDSSQQAHCGQSISFGEAMLGDLAFFVNENGSINHVGIVFGEQMIIHCSGFVKVDQLTIQGIINLDSKVKTHNLHSIRRVIDN